MGRRDLVNHLSRSLYHRLKSNQVDPLKYKDQIRSFNFHKAKGFERLKHKSHLEDIYFKHNVGNLDREKVTLNKLLNETNQLNFHMKNMELCEKNVEQLVEEDLHIKLTKISSPKQKALEEAPLEEGETLFDKALPGFVSAASFEVAKLGIVVAVAAFSDADPVTVRAVIDQFHSPGDC